MPVIYLDHAASSPMLPEVRDAVTVWLGRPGNAASIHRAGREAAAAVEAAREEVAALLGASPDRVVFTSGATEANHLSLRAAPTLRPGRRRVVVGALEHPSVPAAAAATGWTVDTWPADPDGRVRPSPLTEDTGAVACMAVNHESGVLQPVDLARAEADRVGAWLHVDATQAIGRVALSIEIADAIALSAHKIGGPMGVGALVLRSAGPFPCLLGGGSQERGRRAGTVNVAGVVGFGVACRLARVEADPRRARFAPLAEALRAGLLARGGRLIGAGSPRTLTTTQVVFGGLTGDVLVTALDLEGVCASSGAACASGSIRPSPVLAAMNDPEPTGGLRFSFGPATRASDVDAALAALDRILPRVRAALA